MRVTVDIPDQFLHQLVPEGVSASRALLEEAVAAAYRDRRLKSAEQVRQLLGFGTRMQAATFLLQHEIYDYTIEEFESDMATIERMFPADSERPKT